MRNIISIILSVLLLLSSSGITYAQHYCGDMEMLSKVTLGEEYLSCGMAVEADGCEENDSETHKCCDNQYTSVNTDDNFSKVIFNINFDQPCVVALVSVFVNQKTANFDETTSHFPLYHPPPLYMDIPVFYESFLI
jgi:hypothetical protein